jgi:hypothetical protein
MSWAESGWKTACIVREFAHVSNVGRCLEHREHTRSSGIQYVVRSLRSLRAECFGLYRGD